MIISLSKWWQGVFSETIKQDHCYYFSLNGGNHYFVINHSLFKTVISSEYTLKSKQRKEHKLSSEFKHWHIMAFTDWCYGHLEGIICDDENVNAAAIELRQKVSNGNINL